jgi:hypothetical protein
MTLIFYRHIFEKYTNIKFHENSSSGSRAVSRRRKPDRHDMRKMIFAFLQFYAATWKEASKGYLESIFLLNAS